MERTWKAVAVLEALIILVLGVLYLSKGDDHEEVGLAGPERMQERSSHSLEATAPLAPDFDVPAVRKAVDSWTESDALGITIVGCVTDQDSRSIDRAWVVATHSDGTTLQGRVADNTTYAIAGLTPGDWSIRCRVSGYLDFERKAHLKASPTVRRMDITLEKAVDLKVRLQTPQGEDLNERIQQEQLFRSRLRVIAVATREAPGTAIAMTDRSEHSNFGMGEYEYRNPFRRTLGGLPKEFDGVLHLKGGLPTYVSAVLRHAVLDTVLVPEGAEEVSLTVSLERLRQSLCTLRLAVLDGDRGGPVSSAKVTVSDRQAGSSGTPVEEDGSLVLENQPPGLLRLQIFAPGYEAVEQYIRLNPGDHTDLGEFWLARGVRVSGVVLDPDGKPAGGVHLYWRHIEQISFPQPLDLGRVAIADADGRFEIGGIGKRRCLIFVEKSHAAINPHYLDARTGVPREIRIQLQQGTEVKFYPKLIPNEEYMLTIYDENRLPVFAARIRSERVLSRQLMPGSYVVEAARDTGERTTQPLEVGLESLRCEIEP